MRMIISEDENMSNNCVTENAPENVTEKEDDANWDQNNQTEALTDRNEENKNERERHQEDLLDKVKGIRL